MSKESQVKTKVAHAKQGRVSRAESDDERVVGRERAFIAEVKDIARLLPRFAERPRRLAY